MRMSMPRESDDRSARDRAFDTYLWLFITPFGIGIILQMAASPERSALAGFGLLGTIIAGVLCVGYTVYRYRHTAAEWIRRITP